jgi:hypothetical protein
MATGARVAGAIACARKSMGRRSEGVVVERTAGAGGSEVRRRLAGPRDRHQLGSKEAALSAGIPQQWAAREVNNVGLPMKCCRLRAVRPVSDN